MGVLGFEDKNIQGPFLKLSAGKRTGKAYAIGLARWSREHFNFEYLRKSSFGFAPRRSQARLNKLSPEAGKWIACIEIFRLHRFVNNSNFFQNIRNFQRMESWRGY